MLRLNRLYVGDLFKVAHPEQKSRNDRKMVVGRIYRVTKVYVQSPYYRICIDTKDPKDGYYSLDPFTVILLPREQQTFASDVERFAKIYRTRPVILGYKLTWDGKTDISHVCSSSILPMVKLLFAQGKEVFSRDEIKELLDLQLHLYCKVPRTGAYNLFLVWRRSLINGGIIKEIVDTSLVHESAREAGIV